MDVVDSIEGLIYGVVALAFLLFLMFLGIRGAHRLAGPVGSGLGIGAILVVAGLVARDVQRKRWTLVSTLALGAYGLCLVAVIATDAFKG